jgi:type IV pilus assembly protein PilX
MNRLSALNRLGCRVVRSQAGAVLIVSLVLLLVLTILGVSGVQNTTMEERMAGNYRDRFSAFQAAEAALRVGERAVGVYTTFIAMDFDGSDGTFDSDKFTGSADPMDPDNYVNVSAATISGVAATPEFFIERVPKVPLSNSSLVVGFQGASKDVQYYRITGKGTGSGGRAEVILQSTFHR